MKVLMFGWEFPPESSGGLGTACFGLTKALSEKGVKISFVLPRLSERHSSSHVKLIGANVKRIEVESPLTGYMTESGYEQVIKMYGSRGKGPIYGKNLFAEVHRYALKARTIAKEEKFDVIHAHDWMAYDAGLTAKHVSGKPLVVHVHATEFDRVGGSNINTHVYEAEKRGMEGADKVIAVSNYTKNIIVNNYGINPEKVEVVHNGVDFDYKGFGKAKINDNEKLVLFLGRLTLQKGPDYFLYAARKILDHYKNARFVIAGSGDMEMFLIEKAAELGISHKITFTGHMAGDDVDRLYQMADVYVMPSVSEPFGITPLEALKNNVPVIISKQSGISEVISHALKVDFWDINELSNKIISVLKYSPLHETLVEYGREEAKEASWHKAADKCINIYRGVANG